MEPMQVAHINLSKCVATMEDEDILDQNAMQSQKGCTVTRWATIWLRIEE